MEKTYISVTKKGGFSLRGSEEGLTSEIASKMTANEYAFHTQLMSSESYRNILLLVARESAALRGHAQWDEAVETGANIEMTQ